MFTTLLLIASVVPIACAGVPSVEGEILAKDIDASVQVRDASGARVLWRVDKKTHGLGGVLVLMEPWDRERRVGESYDGPIPQPFSPVEMRANLKDPSYRVSDDLLPRGIIIFGDDTVRPSIGGVYPGQKLLVVNESQKPKLQIRIEGVASVYHSGGMPARSAIRIEIANRERSVLVRDLVKSNVMMTLKVMKNPLWSITARDGSFRIPKVPSGDYRIWAIGKSVINLRTGRVEDESEALRIKVEDSNVDVGRIRVATKTE